MLDVDAGFGIPGPVRRQVTKWLGDGVRVRAKPSP